MFRSNQFSPAAFAYSFGTGIVSTDVVEHVAAANLRGSLFTLPAGPVDVAVGAEYRRDSIKGDADPLSLAFAFATGNGQRYQGKVKVAEAYAEAIAPLIANAPFAHKLELNGAFRRTHYNLSGSVSTWKLGAIYEPVEGARLRITRSRDIRAPNATELFSGRTQAVTNATDVRGPGNPDGSGVFQQVQLTSTSNPNLATERGNTWTVGVVLQPEEIVPNLMISADFFKIHLSQAIGRIGGSNIVQRCAAGATEFCSLMTRDPASRALVAIEDRYLNFGANRVRGFDVELSYRLPLDRVFENSDSQLNFTILATKLLDLITTDSAGSVDRAGSLGQQNTLLVGPDLVVDGTIGFTRGAFSATLQNRYIKGGKYDATLIGPDDPSFSITHPRSINNNRVDGRLYQNLGVSYRFESRLGRFQVYGAVNNLLDKDPPPVVGANMPTAASFFDSLGRAYRAGIRVEY